MNYELAKKLKDAGFPQHGEEVFSCALTGCWLVGELYGYENAHNFTLSELIAACGNGYSSLERINTDAGLTWICHGTDDDTHEFGSTPDEAVANLFLALNEKA